MNSTSVEQIANAVLYEGYLLYPYRASAVKNQQRFNFGVVMPRTYREVERGAESCEMQTECLLLAAAKSVLTVRVRFLHLRRREVRLFDPSLAEWTADALSRSIELSELEVDGCTYRPCDEAVEREVTVSFTLGDSSGGHEQAGFQFGANQESEPLGDKGKGITGALIRTQEPVAGVVELIIEDGSIPAVSDRKLWRVSLKVTNESPLIATGRRSREEALRQSLVSLHAIFTVDEGEFVSLLEPPAAYRAAAASCRNTGWWPVLAGERDRRDTLLSSPIILYDYPEIAAESAGELFDGTEIDEILTLRIMTLTDQEKEEMRLGDERARRILERTEAMAPEQFMKLHGVLRRPRALGDEPA